MIQIAKFTPSLLLLLFMVGCSTNATRCESIETLMAQRHKCEELTKQIKKTRSVVVRTNLQQIYEKECVDLRYYRDSFDDKQICSVKESAKGVKKAEKASRAQK